MKVEFEKDDLQAIAGEVAALIAPLLSGKGTIPAVEDPVFDVSGLAEYLKTTPKWVYNHIHDLPYFKIDGLLRFRKKAIDRLFEQNPSTKS